MTTPVVKRRRDITVRPPVRRRESSPAEATVPERQLAALRHGIGTANDGHRPTRFSLISLI